MVGERQQRVPECWPLSALPRVFAGCCLAAHGQYFALRHVSRSVLVAWWRTKAGSEAEHLVESAGPHTTRCICASCLFMCCARARLACARTCGRRGRSCRTIYIHISISIHQHARSAIFTFSSAGPLYQACKLYLILGHLCTAAQSCSATQGRKCVGTHSSPHPFTTVSKSWSR